MFHRFNEGISSTRITGEFNVNSSALFMLNNDGIYRMKGNDHTGIPVSAFGATITDGRTADNYLNVSTLLPSTTQEN